MIHSFTIEHPLDSAIIFFSVIQDPDTDHLTIVAPDLLTDEQEFLTIPSVHEETTAWQP